MLKHTVTYTDPLTDREITEELYFNLTKAEVYELSLDTKMPGESDAIDLRLQRIIESGNPREIFGEFKALLGMAYGMRSSDGKRFIKDPEATAAFLSSEAFSEIMMSFFRDADGAAKFIRAMLPKDLGDEAAKGMETIELPSSTQAATDDDRPDWLKGGRAPTVKELRDAPVKYRKDAFRLQVEARRKQTEDSRPAWLREERSPTEEEIQNISPEYLAEAMRLYNL